MSELTGQESSILALIAQRVYGGGELSKRDKAKFYGMLGYNALQIAKAMTGDNPRSAKRWRDAAQYFKDWVHDESETIRKAK